MLKNREEIHNNFKWDIEKIYLDKDAFEKDIFFVEQSIPKILKFKGTLGTDYTNLRDMLKLYEEISRKIENLYTYANMKHHEDTRINENQANTSKIQMINSEFDVATSFIVPEIITMDNDILEQYLEIPDIAFYKKFIKDIVRKKPHVLSEKEEKIIAATSEISSTSEDVYEILTYSDMTFPEITDENNKKVELNHFNYSTYIRSPKREVRKDAFFTMFNTFDKYKNTIATTLYGNIKSEIFYSKIRNYKSAIEASLFEDDVNVDIYNNLIEAIHDGIPLFDKYMDLKKRFLKLDELRIYDLYVPLVEDFELKIPYEEAKQIILEALKPLGEEYLNIIRKAFEERWVDVFPNEGKRSGAYSWGSYDSYPYILLNYNDDLNSLFTLIHELGHSVHSYYSRENQPYIYSHYKIFVAEVASTVNETLLIHYLLKNSKNKSEKLYLLNYYLEQFRTTVYRQTLFAEFEKITHEKIEAGTPLTASEFNEIYLDLNKLYYGKNVVLDDVLAVEWSRIPHFYSNFYVYKYATGFSAAAAISYNILNDKNSISKYINFLKSGGSKFPLEQLKDAGVDMKDKKSIVNALNIFSDLVNELEKELI